MRLNEVDRKLVFQAVTSPLPSPERRGRCFEAVRSFKGMRCEEAIRMTPQTLLPIGYSLIPVDCRPWTVDYSMKPDNIIPDLTNPQNWNLYTYVKGNPVNFNDPSGHFINPPHYGSVSYMQGVHSFGMTWFDQFSNSWQPWAGQTSENSWYFGATKDAFWNYVWYQYVGAIGTSTYLSPIAQPTLQNVAPIGQLISLTEWLASIDVQQNEMTGAIAEIVLAAHSLSAYSEAPVVIVRVECEIKVLVGEEVACGSIDRSLVMDWLSKFIRNKDYTVLASGHAHGPGLVPFPSNDPGDQVQTMHTVSIASPEWLDKYGNFFLLTPESVLPFNRCNQNWDYAILPP